jgi:hypothetical protein
VINSKTTQGRKYNLSRHANGALGCPHLKKNEPKHRPQTSLFHNENDRRKISK